MDTSFEHANPQRHARARAPMPVFRPTRAVIPASIAALLFASTPSAAAEGALPARDQADVDITAVPADLGAVFVPALEGRTPDDVTVVVRQSGKTVAVGRLGRRIAVPPGHYDVLVGDGPLGLRATTPVDVEEGETADVSPAFGVVRFAVVDPRGQPVEDTFTVGEAPEGRTFGPFHSTVKEGEKTSVVAYLPAGTYSLALGKNPRAEEGSQVLVVTAGQVTRLRLVVDDGRLLRSEVGEAEVAEKKGPWKLRWVLAADGSLASRSNQLGGFNGQSLMLGGYTKLDLSLDTGRHLAKLDVMADESAVGILAGSGTSTSETPIQKLVDDVRAELLYTYRLGGVIGPYGHAMGMTSLFPTKYYPGRTLDATTYGPNGEIARRDRMEPGTAYRLFPELGPLVTQEGAGVGSAFEGDVFRFAIRGGVAARQAFFFDGRYPTALEGDTLKLQQVADVSTFGAEATASLGFRIRGLLDVDSRLDAFVGEDQFSPLFKGEGTYRPVYRWDNSAALRLGKYVSLVYTFGLRRDAQAIERDQMAHALRLRFAWSVF